MGYAGSTTSPLPGKPFRERSFGQWMALTVSGARSLVFMQQGEYFLPAGFHDSGTRPRDGTKLETKPSPLLGQASILRIRPPELANLCVFLVMKA